MLRLVCVIPEADMRRRTFITLLGGAASRSASAFAQAPPRVPRIGLLLTGSSAISEAFRQGLSQFGYFEGRSIIIEFRSAGETEELLQHARELVKLEVDLIVAGATPAGRAAQQATKTIPIIVSAMGDPVHDGLVASLSRPGANVTGTTFLGPELVPKRLAFFKELLPNMSRVAILWHPGAYGEHTTSEMRKEVSNAAATLGIQLQFFEAQTPDSIDEALTAVAGTDIEALFQARCYSICGDVSLIL